MGEPAVSIGGVKAALVAAGLEIYRVRGTEVEVAERVRLHLMDSHIRVRLTDGGSCEVRFTARAQRSDHPGRKAEELFELVRQGVGPDAVMRGFHEAGAVALEVNDPIDKQKLLDVWYEVTYAKNVPSIDEATGEAKWALALERYVAR